MKKYANAFLKWVTSILEVVIALILAVTIIIMTFQLLLSFPHLSDLNQYPNYDDMLTTCFNLIIGVEMIRMLYLHTPITVFEVLLFAIARQIIIEHGSPINSTDRRDCHCNPVCYKKVSIYDIRRIGKNYFPFVAKSQTHQSSDSRSYSL